MASPSIDNTAQGFSIGSNTLTGSITVANNTILLIGVGIDQSSGETVSTLAATGLTFSKYGGFTAVISAGNCRLELWSAPVASGQTVNFTITLSGTPTGAHHFSVSVKSLYDITSWWDDNPAVFPNPATASDMTSGALVTYSTSEADDLILLWSASIGVGGLSAPTDPGWSTAIGTFAGGGIVGRVDQRTVSTVQTSQTVMNHNSSGTGTLGLVVALTADAKGFKLQTFVTTICT